MGAGETQLVTVSFSPQEVDSFDRELECTCANLPDGAPRPRVRLTARSKRPYCHFELTESDYVRAGRRPAGMPGPDGSLSPLDPETKVVEFESLGCARLSVSRSSGLVASMQGVPSSHRCGCGCRQSSVVSRALSIHASMELGRRRQQHDANEHKRSYMYSV